MNITDVAFDRAIEYARKLGTEHGINAAGWYEQDTFGGRVDGLDAVHNARRILDGITSGDPEILDTLPSADLSGEWADTLTGPQLVDDALSAAGVWLDTPEGDPSAERVDWFTDVCDAYELAFADAVSSEIERMARAEVENDWNERRAAAEMLGGKK